MLKILTVGYNEEKNLEKLYSSIWKFKNKIEVDVEFYYVDQESVDNSLDIAKKYWAKTFTHKNKWYADPDKKWLVENVCNEWDWIIIADADFYFSEKMILEIDYIINKSNYDTILLKIDIIFLWIKWISIKGAIFFKKWAVQITEDIHNYYKIKSNKIWTTKESIICDDIKEHWNAISVWLKRIDKYTSIEVKNINKKPKYIILLYLFFSPIIWFFWYWIIHKQFFKWIPWIINSLIQVIYRISLYSKLYEKYYIK